MKKLVQLTPIEGEPGIFYLTGSKKKVTAYSESACFVLRDRDRALDKGRLCLDDEDAGINDAFVQGGDNLVTGAVNSFGIFRAIQLYKIISS